MAVLLIAGVGKLIDLSAFRESLREWLLIPAFVRDAAWFVLPTAEVAIAASWYLGYRRVWMERAAMAVLAMFVVTIAFHMAGGLQPKCHCFGAISQYVEFLSGARSALIRGLLLLVLLVVAQAGTLAARQTSQENAA